MRNLLTLVLAVVILAIVEIFFVTGCTTKAPVTVVTTQSLYESEINKQVLLNISQFDSASDDMTRFCPKYKTLLIGDRAQAITKLLAGIMKYESGNDPTQSYDEGDGMISIGLFQLSYGDSFCPKSSAVGDLKDPNVNIACAVKIAGSLVQKDSVVAAGGYTAYGAASPKGLARYWSVIRVPDSKSKHYLSELIAIANQSTGCK